MPPKPIAFLLIISLLFSTITAPSPLMANPASESLSLPAPYGKIEESVVRPGQKKVIFIQDAHDSLEAQQNIASLITNLVESGRVKTVFEEGYEGPVPSDKYFGSIKNRQVREKVSYFLMDFLRLGGAEYAHINRKKDFKLIGADDERLHWNAIRHYRQTVLKAAGTRADSQKLRNEMEVLIQRSFPPEMKKWLKLKERQNEKQIDLLDYVQRTRGLLESAMTAEAFAAAFPVLHKILSLRFSKDEKALKALSEIDAEDLFREIYRLEEECADRLLHEESMKKIFYYVRGLDSLAQLERLEVNPAEYLFVKQDLQNLRTEPLGRFIAQNAGKTLIFFNRWEKTVAQAMAFYEAALKREAAVEARLAEFSANKNENECVLVYGGFHKDGILEILKKKNFSYEIVMPSITTEDPVHRKLYKKLMLMKSYAFETPVNLARASRPISFYGRALRAGENAAKSEIRAMAGIAAHYKILETSMLRRKMIEELPRPSRSESRIALADKGPISKAIMMPGLEAGSRSELLKLDLYYDLFDQDHPLVEYVTRIASKLAQTPGAKDFWDKPPKIYIFKEHPGELGAALPDGSMIFSLKMLNVATSEDALAFMIGHEMTHIQNGHAQKEYEKRKKGDIRLLDYFGHARLDEYESDFTPVISMLAQAGYNPMAGVSFFEEVRKAFKGNSWSKEHGSLEDRRLNLLSLRMVLDLEGIERTQQPVDSQWKTLLKEAITAIPETSTFNKRAARLSKNDNKRDNEIERTVHRMIANPRERAREWANARELFQQIYQNVLEEAFTQLNRKGLPPASDREGPELSPYRKNRLPKPLEKKTAERHQSATLFYNQWLKKFLNQSDRKFNNDEKAALLVAVMMFGFNIDFFEPKHGRFGATIVDYKIEADGDAKSFFIGQKFTASIDPGNPSFETLISFLDPAFFRSLGIESLAMYPFADHLLLHLLDYGVSQEVGLFGDPVNIGKYMEESQKLIEAVDRLYQAYGFEPLDQAELRLKSLVLLQEVVPLDALLDYFQATGYTKTAAILILSQKIPQLLKKINTVPGFVSDAEKEVLLLLLPMQENIYNYDEYKDALLHFFTTHSANALPIILKVLRQLPPENQRKLYENMAYFMGMAGGRGDFGQQGPALQAQFLELVYTEMPVERRREVIGIFFHIYLDGKIPGKRSFLLQLEEAQLKIPGFSFRDLLENQGALNLNILEALAEAPPEEFWPLLEKYRNIFEFDVFGATGTTYGGIAFDFVEKAQALLEKYYPEAKGNPEKLLLLTVLFADLDKKHRVHDFALNQVLKDKNLEDALEIIFGNKEKGILGVGLTATALEEVVENKSQTPDQMEALKAYLLEFYHGEAGSQAGLGVGIDGFLELAYADKTAFMKAALESRTSDRLLKELGMQDWWDRVGSVLISDAEMNGLTYMEKESAILEWITTLVNPFDFKENEVSLVNYGEYMSVSEVLDRLYTSTPAQRHFILRKMLLGPEGVLQNKKATKVLMLQFLQKHVAIQAENLARVNQTVSTLIDVLSSDQLYFLISPLLSQAIFQKLGQEEVPPYEVVRDFVGAESYFSKFHDADLAVSVKHAGRKIRTHADAATERLTLQAFGESERLKELTKAEALILADLPEEYRKPADAEVLSEMQAGKAVVGQGGAVAVRGAQAIGQYVPIDPEKEDAFSEFYDRMKGQSKLAAYETVKRYAPGILGKKGRIIKRLGGGSLMTSYLIQRENGKFYVLKVLNPNAEDRVKEMIKAFHELFDLLLQQEPANKVFLMIKNQLLPDLEKWILADINDRRFLENDKKFRQKYHKGRIYIPESYAIADEDLAEGADPEEANKRLKLEEYIPGTNLTQLKIGPVDDFENGQVTQETFKDLQAVRAQNFQAQVESDLGLVLSDIHDGNNILMADGRLAVIDRNFYIELQQTDRTAISQLQKVTPWEVIQGLGQPQRILAIKIDQLLDYLFKLDENKAKVSERPAIREKILAHYTTVSDVTSLQTTEGLSQLVLNLKAEGLTLPLFLTLLQKDIKAMEKSSRKAGMNFKEALARRVRQEVRSVISQAAPQPVAVKSEAVTSGKVSLSEVRRAPQRELPVKEVLYSSEKLQKKFTVFADLSLLNQLSDAQFAEDFEKTGLLYSNLTYVFYGSAEGLSEKAQKRLEQLQKDFSDSRIRISGTSFKETLEQPYWQGQWVHLAKGDWNPDWVSERLKKLHRFRYLEDEIRLLPAALLHVEQHPEGDQKVRDLNGIEGFLLREAQTFFASMVIAQSA